MRKLISFCLHGEKDKYCQGFYENLSLAKEFYPEWEVILFHDNTVPFEWLNKYKEFDIEIPDESAENISTVQAAVDFIKEKAA